MSIFMSNLKFRKHGKGEIYVIDYILENKSLIISLSFDHLLLFFIAIILAVFSGLFLGVFIFKWKKLSFIDHIINAFQAAPELVLLALAVLFFGVGIKAALIALFVKGILPILRNTYSGIESVDKNIVEAAIGMGMSKLQILFKIELPLALPVILSGIRVSSVMTISTLTLAAYIGVDSLGVLITRGIAMSDTYALLTGSILTALLAIVFNYLILFLEKKLSF